MYVQVRMEKLKKQTAVIRAAFSRNLGILSTELAQERPNIQEIQARFAIVKDKACELQELNQKICEVMLENGLSELVQENESANEYNLKYQRIKQEVIKRTEVNQREPSSSTSDSQTIHTARDNTRTFKLPRIELKKFSGDLKEWLQFWSLFKHIHQDPNMAKEDKFQYLIQAMVRDSRASEPINSFPPTAENYDKAYSFKESIR